MVWPIMGGACRRSIHLKDGVEASQRVRSSGEALGRTLAFNEQSGTVPGQKSASRKSPLTSSKPVSGYLPVGGPLVQNRAPGLLCAHSTEPRWLNVARPCHGESGIHMCGYSRP